MATITKEIPSGSTDGVPVKVAATATAGTLFHTASGTASVKDEIYLFLSNTSASDVVATVEFGGVSSPDNHIKVTVPANKTILAVPGIPLANSKVCRVFAATGNVLTMSGYVNRITP